MIGIIDYGMGNLRSVEKALQHLGAPTRFVQKAEEIGSLDGLVLPGVGAFGDAMKNLRDAKLIDPISEWIHADRPFFGICLGYQLLFEESEESPGVAGLSLFRGKVVRFEEKSGLKIPQIGWNRAKIEQQNLFLRNLEDESFFYFVHSFYPQPKDESLPALTTTYGVPFTSAISRGHLFAAQFHPEKSQAAGLKLLENFVALALQSKHATMRA